MTTRTAALCTIGLIAFLLVAVAFAALYAGEISERVLSIVTTILSTLATVLAGLLLFLRVETVAEKAANVESKVDNLHHDVLNGGLRENVVRAIQQTEDDPKIRETRIENAAKGVQQDRHDLKNRRTAERLQKEVTERRRLRHEDSSG